MWSRQCAVSNIVCVFAEISFHLAITAATGRRRLRGAVMPANLQAREVVISHVKIEESF